MALVLADRVQQTGTANTTVSFTLTGSVSGFQSFAVVGNGNTTYYSSFDTSGNWEVGLGTYSTTGPTLTRTTVISSSNAGAAVTFSGGVNIFLTYPAEYAVWASSAPTTAGYVLTSNGAGTSPSWQQGGVGTITVTDFTATAGQTTFTVSYTVGLVQVFQNGAKLGIADYTATTGTSIVLATGAAVGDLIEVVAYSSLNIYSTITYQDFSGTGSQTVFTMNAVPANAASLLVAISGVVQDPSTYTVSSTTLTFSTAPPAGTDNISVRYLGIPSVGSVSSFSAGTTGLTPASNTTGAVTLAGTLNVANGGTGLTSLTAGYIPFGAGTSAFNSSANLFWDNTNARLGIGTSSPVQKLTVDGIIRARQSGSSRYRSDWNVGSTVNFNAFDDIGAVYIPMNWDASMYTWTTGGTEQMRIDSAGNVGIGTSSPASKLDVSGVITMRAAGLEWNQVIATTGYSSGFQFNRAGYNNWFIGSTNNSLNFSIGESLSSPAMTFASGGNVGIGGTPGYKLDVQQNGASNYTLLRLGNTDAGGAGTNMIFTGNGNTAARIKSYYNSAWALSLGTDSFLDTLYMASGNVGIGTTTPNKASSSTALTINTATATNYSSLEITTAEAQRYRISANNGAVYQIIADAVPFMTYVNGSERMRIDSSGNVGIGTTSPATYGKLALAAAATVEGYAVNTATTGQASWWAQNNTGGKTGVFQYGSAQAAYGAIGSGEGAFYSNSNVTVISDTGVIKFATGGNTERMRITSAGGVSFGSSGTAYGTSGQVLTSAGNAPPTWTTVASFTTSQTLQNVGRANGTTYTNSTGNNIMVFFQYGDSSGQPASIAVTINGTAGLNNLSGSPGGSYRVISFVVPAGSTYSISWNASASGNGIWWEFR